MGECMQACDACVGAGSHDASGLKHLGVRLDWVQLGDGSEPKADRVLTLITRWSLYATLKSDLHLPRPVQSTCMVLSFAQLVMLP